MTDTNKIGDAKLAQRVIEAYADLDGLSAKECADIGIDSAHCSALQKAMGTGAEGVITRDEFTDLEKSGFSNEFVNALAGPEGKNALHAHARWLGEHCVKRWWRADADPRERAKMIGELGAIGDADDEAVEALAEAMEDKDADVRWSAAAALLKAGPYYPCARAADFLRAMGPKATQNIPLFIEALSSHYGYTLGAAIDALGDFGPSAATAIPNLKKVFSDSFFAGDQGKVVAALGKIGVAAVPALIDLFHSADSLMGQHVIETIAKSGAAAIPALMEALKDDRGGVCMGASEALGSVGAVAIDPLVAALKDRNRRGREWVARALGNIGPAAAPAVPALIEALGDRDPELRVYAAMAIGKIGPAADGAIPALSEALVDEDGMVRLYAAQALGDIGRASHPALPFLEDMRDNDSNPNCKTYAGEAVEKILKDVK